jgi:hypothetical protein
MKTGRDWLRNPCEHHWHLGPVVDLLMRRRGAVCTKCWWLRDDFPDEEWGNWPEWTQEDYLANQEEIEKRFFSG